MSQWVGPRVSHSVFRYDGQHNQTAGPEELVMMVRDPRKRLWSAYNFGLHAYGLSYRRELLVKAATTPKQYVEFPGIKGCQVKMLNGIHCARDVPVTREMVDHALAVVDKAAFVGITELWNDCMCLFSAMYGGPLPKVVFNNVRNTQTIAKGNYSVSEADKNFSIEDDPDDWTLFSNG